MHVPDTTPPTVPVRKPDFLSTRETPKLRATWLGHACYYVEFPGGLRILFDPVFSERCSPFSWLGPKRYTETPIDVDGIPVVDAVVISHNHYDHLDHPTIMKLHQKHPNIHFFAPLGNKQWFNASGITNVTELDWWESRDLTLAPQQSQPTVVAQPGDASSKAEQEKHQAISATIGCLPCQHTSARTGWDKARTLWSSWSVESGGKKVFFGGDTGKHNHHQQRQVNPPLTAIATRFRLQGRPQASQGRRRLRPLPQLPPLSCLCRDRPPSRAL